MVYVPHPPRVKHSVAVVGGRAEEAVHPEALLLRALELARPEEKLGRLAQVRELRHEPAALLRALLLRERGVEPREPEKVALVQDNVQEAHGEALAQVPEDGHLGELNVALDHHVVLLAHVGGEPRRDVDGRHLLALRVLEGLVRDLHRARGHVGEREGERRVFRPHSKVVKVHAHAARARARGDALPDRIVLAARLEAVRLGEDGRAVVGAAREQLVQPALPVKQLLQRVAVARAPVEGDAPPAAPRRRDERAVQRRQPGGVNAAKVQRRLRDRSARAADKRSKGGGGGGGGGRRRSGAQRRRWRARRRAAANVRVERERSSEREPAQRTGDPGGGVWAVTGSARCAA